MALALQQQRSGATAVAAILFAIGSFVATFSAHPIIGGLLALIAVIAGAIGVAVSVSPRVGGGLLSIVSIVLGVFGLGLSVLGMVGAVIF
jgi:hypothetical protein